MSTAEIEGTLLDPAVQACPFAYHQQLREKAPVYRMPETGFYVISNYEDLKTVLSDPATFSNDIEIEQLAGEAAADLGRMFDDHLAEVGWGHVQTLQRTDPPVHGRYRRLINRTLTPSMVKGMLPSLNRIADDLIDAFIDSTSLRVVARPPLANECDRSEVSAMQLARELLVRVPDGVGEGAQWRDSTVTLVCRSGVPLTVYTITHSTLATVSRETLVVRREMTTRLEGKGGSAFRAFDLVGTGSGSQRLEIAARTGILETLQGSSTLTMQLTERIPPGTPRSQQVLQRVELRAERQR